MGVLVKPLGSTALYAGTLAGTTTATVIGSSQACVEVLVQNDPDNAVDVLVGNSTGRTIQLKPGDGIVLPVADVALVYAQTVSSTATIGWLARS